MDRALGGGLPTGAITEVYGLPGSGARSLARRIASGHGGAGVVWCDLTGDIRRGDLPEDVLVARPDDERQAASITRAALASGEVTLVVFAPLYALAPSGWPVRAKEPDAHERAVAHLVRETVTQLRASRASALVVSAGYARDGVLRSGAPRAITPYIAARIACRPDPRQGEIRCAVPGSPGPGGEVRLRRDESGPHTGDPPGRDPPE